VSVIIEEYLDDVKNNLRLETSTEKEIINELATHIEDEVRELESNGLREEEAASTCLRFLGSARSVARQIYEAHSQGSWRQALMASLPHLLFGLVFFLNWWRGILPVLMLLIAVLGTAVYGWWRGKSTWLFTWLGYSLLPVIAAGLSLLYLPKALAWIAIIVYIPLALWLILRIVGQTIKTDWLHISLMFLPVPIILGWFAATEWTQDFNGSFETVLYSNGPLIGTSFMALAFGVVSFIRIRKRWLKVVVLFMTGVITLGLISSYAQGRLPFINLLLLILLLGSIFFIPAMLENGVRSGRWGKIFEHHPMS
jgi:hypothetical protein